MSSVAEVLRNKEWVPAGMSEILQGMILFI